MIKTYLFIVALFFCFDSWGQTVVQNDNTTIYIEPGGVFYVDGDIETENTGIFDNSGTMHLSGNWINNSTNNGFTSPSGLVRMFGNNQSIGGTNSTFFHNLLLDGGSSTKQLLIDSRVTNELNLVDAELQTNNSVMHVTNPSITSIIWNNGFVSSNTLGGYLSRSTNSINTYTYPVGDYGLANIYRGVDITPSNNDSSVYAVRVAPTDPSFDYTGTSFTGATGGFDVSTKNPLLGNINTTFYHNIARTHGTNSADVNVHYFLSDGDFETMAHWLNSTNRWESTAFMNTSNTGPVNLGSPNMISSVSLLNNFNHDIFSLSNVFGVRIPQFISPNGDGQNDLLIIDNISFYPDNKLQVFNRYGSLVYEKNSYLNQWDGKINEKASNIFNYTNGTLPSGTYFYVLDLGIEGFDPYTGYIQIRK